MSLPRGAADRRIDRSGARGKAPAGQREVNALHLALAHHLLQRSMGRVVAGDDQQSAGLLVETMDDAGSLRVGTATEDLAQLVDQGGAAVRGSRLDDEAGWLLDHREVLVKVDDAELHAHRSVSAR